MKDFRAVIAIVAFVWTGISVSVFGQDKVENTCVSCHKKTFGKDLLDRNYLDWKGSAHADHEITCDVCHDGDPTKSDKEKSHAGMTKADDAESHLYKKNIPEFCGQCHEKEFKNFKSSLHYKRLIEKGRGPNCVTCHGKIAARVPTPKTIMTICEACHKDNIEAPIRASKQYRLISEYKKKITHLRGFLSGASSEDFDTIQAEYQLSKADNQLSDFAHLWHSFKLKSIEQKVYDIDNLITLTDDMMHPIKKKSKLPWIIVIVCAIIVGVIAWRLSTKYTISIERVKE